MASSRDLRRPEVDVAPSSRALAVSAQFSLQAHHLDRRHGRLKSLVPGLDSGAVQRLLQRLAGQHAKAVRNARLLLRLADARAPPRCKLPRSAPSRRAAGSPASQSRLLCLHWRWCAPPPGISHAPGTRTTSMSVAFRAAAQQRIKRPSSSRSVITAFQRATTIANFIPSAERSPSTATGFPFTGSVHAQKLTANPGSGSTVKMPRLPVVSVTGDSRETAASPTFARSQFSAAW